MDSIRCIECGDQLVAERAELGYRYCTKKQCQAKHHKGLTITTIGVNKSADTVMIGDQDEIRRRAEAGEFGKKDSGLGIDYRGLGIDYRSLRPAADPPARAAAHRPPASRPAARRPWTTEQERIVRLYHGMGLNPRQIVARARENTPRLGITESLATKIICALPPR